MVSSSLDKSIKKALEKETAADPSDSVSTNTNNSFVHDSGVKRNGDRLPHNEKILSLFPKCKPRNDYQYQTSTTTPLDTSVSTKLISIASSPSSQAIQSFSTQANSSSHSFNMNNSKLLKLQQLPKSPPDHKKQHSHQSQFYDHVRSAKISSKHEPNDNYAETNPFRIDSNNQYFYTPNDSLFDNNNSAIAASEDNSMMHHYHYPPMLHRNYQMTLEDRNYFFEPDEIEHNPYMVDTMASSMNQVPSSILKASPPATPPALTTTPTDSSPIGSNRNIWDLSPIKSNTPTRIKTQSPAPFSRSHKGSYKKLLASPLPIEEDLETGHFYYNNKKTYYQAPQTDSDSNEPATITDVHEVEKLKPEPFYSRSKIKHSESSYAEVRKKEDRKIVKSKSGSGIMEYDGSPRRFGTSSNEDIESHLQSSSNKIKALQSKPLISNNSSPSPPRPGFPQRVVPCSQYSRDDSPNESLKNYSYSEQKIIPSYEQKIPPYEPKIPPYEPKLPPYESKIPPYEPKIPPYEPKISSYSSEQKIPSYNEQKLPSYSEPKIPAYGESKLYSSSEQKIHSSSEPKIVPTTTSQLIPTTFINSNAYDTPQPKTQTIHEEQEDEIFKSKSSILHAPPEEKPDTKPRYDSTLLENSNSFQVTSPTEEYIPTSTFDYLYEFSETRKVLEEFFKCPDSDQIKELEKFSDFNESDDSLDIQYDYRGQIEKEMEKIYNKQVAPTIINQERDIDDDNRDDKEDDEEEEAYLKAKQNRLTMTELEEKNKQFGCFVDSASRSSLGDDNVDNENDLDNSSNRRTRRMSKSLTNNNYFRTQSKNFNYSPDTTDYDSNYGDFDFESESPLRFLAPDYTNMPPYTTIAATMPSATVDLSGGPINNYARYCTSMPVLEDGLSSGHASDNENNNQVASATDMNSLNKRKTAYTSSISTIQKQYQDTLVQNQTGIKINSNVNNFNNSVNNFAVTTKHNPKNNINENDFRMRSAQSPPNCHPFYPMRHDKDLINSSNNIMNSQFFKNRDLELDSLCTSINTLQSTPPPPAPVPHRQTLNESKIISPTKQEPDIHSALKDIRTSLQKSKMGNPDNSPTNAFSNNNCNVGDYYERTIINEKVDSPTVSLSPVWIPRSRDKSALSPIHSESGPLLKHKNEDDEEDVDTDLETDRLLGHKMLDDGFYDDKSWTESKQHRPLLSSTLTSKISPKINQHSSKSSSSSILRHGLNVLLPTSSSSDCCINSPSMLTTNAFHQSRSLKTSPSINTNNSPNLIHPTIEPTRQSENLTPRKIDLLDEPKGEPPAHNNNLSETSDLCNLDSEVVDSPGGSSTESKKDEALAEDKKKRNKNKEVLIEGVLFRARYLGSTQLVCEGQPTKSTRMMQAEEAVSRIKAPDGENQPSTEVDLFISTEKIMVLNTDLKEIMMDHALRTISYIADIGDLVVLMARRRFVPQDVEANSDSGTGTGGSGNVSGGSGGPTPPTSGKINRTPKMICHVFESSDASYIASSIGTAFQVAYMEFLKANGIEDHSFMKEMDYQEVLNSQEIFGDELEIFAKKELQKEVVVPKAKGEILGVVIVESGWGSMLPTVVIANLASNGAAARCGQLNIGDQIIAINGLSLVGLPLSQCQTYIKNTKNQTVVKFTVVPCAPVVEVKIKRPNTKYQLGFSVQNGVICSLLRGGIAERGGVRVGHRIIEINNQSVVAVPHEKIVNLLATSVGEILMKTMPTSMFRLLTGQENPIYI